MADLVHEIKELIINSLNLEGTTPEEIGDDDPLFASGLGLDSIDALELAVAIERTYKVTIPDEAVGKQVFSSVKTLAAYVAEHRGS
ncbi:MAG: phosphopantetheine-binding protein [Polyangia bacterium]